MEMIDHHVSTLLGWILDMEYAGAPNLDNTGRCIVLQLEYNGATMLLSLDKVPGSYDLHPGLQEAAEALGETARVGVHCAFFGATPETGAALIRYARRLLTRATLQLFTQQGAVC